MFVFYGTRSGGKVDQRDGQYALTRFAHINWMPLFPTGSFWITAEGVGHEMKLSARSVIAGYSRTWAVPFAIAGLFGFGGTIVFGMAVGLVALAALSWAWKDTNGTRHERRSDMNQLAFGTRCEPKYLPAPLVASLTAELDERWAVLADGQSPGDVAQYGTEDVDRAAAAYGVLRLKALALPAAQARQAEGDAQRIAEGVRDKLQIGDGGPYRARLSSSLSSPLPGRSGDDT